MPRRATKQQVAVTIGLLTAVVAAGVWWAPHIWWSYLLSRNSVKVDPVKVVEMPPAKPTNGWFTCRVGPLTFKLPPSMADEAERSVASLPHALNLTTASQELTVMVPYEIPAGSQRVIAETAASLNLSPLEMIAESFRTGTGDFRWTMSHSELHRHQQLLGLWYIYPHRDVAAVETWYGDPLAGLLRVHDDRSHAFFEWRLKSEKAVGFVQFHATKGELNLDDIRAVCQSLSCDESRVGPELTKDQLAVLADTMKIELEAVPAGEPKSKDEK